MSRPDPAATTSAANLLALIARGRRQHGADALIIARCRALVNYLDVSVYRWADTGVLSQIPRTVSLDPSLVLFVRDALRRGDAQFDDMREVGRREHVARSAVMRSTQGSSDECYRDWRNLPVTTAMYLYRPHLCRRGAEDFLGLVMPRRLNPSALMRGPIKVEGHQHGRGGTMRRQLKALAREFGRMPPAGAYSGLLCARAASPHF